MDYFLAVLFGIVEGVTEFLPVSSTAHLRILKPMFNIPLDDTYWKMFDVVIQLGAVMCLPVYFKKKILRFIESFPRSVREGQWLSHPATLVMVAFLLTAGPSFLLKKMISQNLESLKVMGSALLIGGALMWAVDVMFTRPRTTDLESVNLLQAAWIGILQNLAAIFPGTSRSMVTIAAGQTAMLSRSAALEFSFFVSMPTMLAACGWDLWKTIHPGQNDVGLAPGSMTAHRWIVLAIGFIVSFFVAWAVVAFFMKWVRRRGFVPFAIYRIVLGLIILLWLYRP